jgi:beta-glucosidase
MASSHVALLALFTFQLAATLSQGLAVVDNEKDALTLLKIKEQFGNPAALGPWRNGTDHCIWWIGAECDEHRRVIYLFFRGRMNITSTLPPAIGELDQLQAITIVDMPGLSGPIPDTFGDLSCLSTLNIVGTSVSGAIPASLSRATSLASINLSRNKLSGSIPRSLGQGLPRLVYFNAANNYLVGAIPARLVRGGTANLPAALTLSNNRLTGKIPWTYAVENNLIQLWVANNRLVGDASFLFGRRKAMVYMDLSGNKLRFNLRGVEMPEGLQELNLARNRIYGRVPATLRQSKVVALDLSYNELCGEIPTGGQMVRFEAAAYVHNQCLCGTPLPSC